MAKKTGGVRNYARYTKTYKKMSSKVYLLLAVAALRERRRNAKGNILHIVAAPLTAKIE